MSLRSFPHILLWENHRDLLCMGVKHEACACDSMAVSRVQTCVVQTCIPVQYDGPGAWILLEWPSVWHRCVELNVQVLQLSVSGGASPG